MCFNYFDILFNCSYMFYILELEEFKSLGSSISDEEGFEDNVQCTEEVDMATLDAEPDKKRKKKNTLEELEKLLMKSYPYYCGVLSQTETQLE